MSVQLRPKWEKIRNKPDLISFDEIDTNTGIVAEQRAPGAVIQLDTDTSKGIWSAILPAEVGASSSLVGSISVG